MYSGGFMRNTTTLLVGLSTLLLFFSTHGIPLVNAQTSSPTDNTSNDNSASQTQNSDPFTQKGSDNNINTGSDNSRSQTSDGSSNNNDGSKPVTDQPVVTMMTITKDLTIVNHQIIKIQNLI